MEEKKENKITPEFAKGVLKELKKDVALAQNKLDRQAKKNNWHSEEWWVENYNEKERAFLDVYEKKNTSKRKIESVADILKKEVIDEPFILQSMIPENAISALTADVGKGKSIVALKMAEAIATGNKLFGTYEVKKKKVLILDMEMSENDITNRVHSIIQGPADIFFNYQSFQIDNKTDYEWLVGAIKENGFELVIFDTLNSAHGKEENSASEMRDVNRKLLDLINETHITILYLHHHRKPQKGENYSQASSRGSTEILAKVASHLLLDSRDITVIDKDGAGFSGLHITITQFKARLTDKLKAFGIDVWYNSLKKKTFWKYTGEFESENAGDIAKKFVLDTIKESEEWSIQDLVEESIRQKLNFKERNLRDAVRDFEKIGKLESKSVGSSGRKMYCLTTEFL